MGKRIQKGHKLLGKKTLGALEYRSGALKSQAQQSQHGGKRYNLTEDRQIALSKAQQKKQALMVGKTVTGQQPDFINLEPEKNDILGQGIR